jgi:hypothetical protein
VSREYQDNGAVYRVHIDYLYADESGSFMTRTFGPYSSLATARSQASRLRSNVTREGRKATARIESAHTYWEQVTL